MSRIDTIRAALEYYAMSLKPPYDMADDGKRAREALAAMDASGTATPPAAGSRGEGLPEREYAALLRVAEAAESVAQSHGIMPSLWDELRDALAELRRVRGNGGSDGP